jgi:hypothetical protein
MTAQFPRGARVDALRRALAATPPALPALSVLPAPSASSAAGEGADPAPTDPDEQEIVGWLTRLHRLEGVPFHYLVPDGAMLPAESIRFFQVDPNWLDALLDGAFSVGGPPSGTDADRPRTATPSGPQELGGFLLRSAAVSGWPGMEAHAYGDPAGTDPLAQVRLERIAPSILLGLYAGVVRRLELTEPAEALHFGADAAGPGRWTKTLRYAQSGNGHVIGEPVAAPAVPVPLRPTPNRAVLRAADLAAAIDPLVWPGPRPAPDPFDPGLFALEMVEGVQAVAFTVP